MARKEVLPKVIALLEGRGFVRKRLLTHSKSKKKVQPNFYYSFGPAGTIVKRNIVQAWWDSTVIGRQSTFPVQNCVPFHGQNKKLGIIEEHYLPLAELVGHKLPFSIAQVEKSNTDTITEKTSHWGDENNEKKFLFEDNLQTNLSLHLFCDPVKSVRTYDALLMARRNWWQQYAAHPQNFSVTEIESNADGSSTARIQYQFPWGPDTLETISNLQDKPFSLVDGSKLDRYKCKNLNKTVLPTVLSCTAALEKGFLAFMLDAYTESSTFTVSQKSKLEKLKCQVQLHPSLSPYKMAVVLNGNRTRDMRELADDFSADLRQAGIAVLCIYDDDKTIEHQFARNDELGIPYTVVVEDTSLQTGIVHMRSRDTTLKEGTHVTKLKEFILKNIVTTARELGISNNLDKD